MTVREDDMETLQQWRGRMGWSRPEASKATGLGYQAIYYKEIGRSPVSRYDALACAAAEAGLSPPAIKTRDTMAAEAIKHGLEPTVLTSEAPA